MFFLFQTHRLDSLLLKTNDVCKMAAVVTTQSVKRSAASKGQTLLRVALTKNACVFFVFTVEKHLTNTTKREKRKKNIT